MNKSIATVIRNNPRIKNRMPILMSELTEWVNSHFETPKSSAAIRNVFVGNNDYYSFKYTRIGYGKYIPIELNSIQKALEAISKNAIFKKAEISLMYELLVTNQNPQKDIWYIFKKPTDDDSYIYSFFESKIICKFIDIEDKQINNYILLMDFEAMKHDYERIKQYVLEKNISKSTIMDAFIMMHNIKKTIDSPWIFFENKLVDRALLVGLIYAK